MSVSVPQSSVASQARNERLAALIKGVAEGDQQSLSALYDATSGLVYGLILRILGDTATAEEVLMDVFMQVWRQAARFDDERGAPLAWLTTLARSRAIDRLRAGKQDKQRETSLETAGQHSVPADMEQLVAASEMRETVRAALDTLAVEQRQVIELAYYRGLSHSEIAAELGQPLGTVKTRTRLGMIKLRELLRPAFERGL